MIEVACRVLEGDVVWIRPDQLTLPDQPGGFAMRIDGFRGVQGYDDRGVSMIWVFGPWHDGADWQGELELRIPLDQRFAPGFNAICAPRSLLRRLGVKQAA